MKPFNCIKMSVVVLVFLISIKSAMSIQPPSNIEAYLNHESISESRALTGSIEDKTAFEEYVRINWEELLDNIETVSPTSNKQLLIVAGGETLSGREYLQFLNKLFQQTSEGKIESSVFHFAIFSVTSKKVGFLAYNYQDQQVRDWVEAVRVTLDPSSDIRKYLDEILSGDGLEDAEFATLGQGLPEPEILQPLE